MAQAQVSREEEPSPIDDEIIENLLEHPRVGIVIPTKLNSFQMECLVESEDPPFLEVQLLPLKLTTDSINLSGDCILFCEKGVGLQIAYAEIIEVLDDLRIRVEIKETCRKVQARKYFRIDTEIHLRYWPAGGKPPASRQGELQRVNLSANGLRFASSMPMSKGDLIGLEIGLPEFSVGAVTAVARVSRVINAGTESQEFALEMTEVEEADQDDISSFCIGEQCRQIRMKNSLR